MTEYYVPTGAGESEYVEKRSRFLGHVRPVQSEDEARAFIAEIKKQHYDARHNCWCYLLQDGPGSPCWRSSGGRGSATRSAW